MNLAAQVLAAARKRGWRIATAESCTGGLVAAALTDIAGSSDVFDCGFVTYSYESKQKMLGVLPKTLEKYGAVSAAVAAEMARGALQNMHADIAVSITGVAGPGASENKPEGMVWFGICTPDGGKTELHEFGPLGRQAVRNASTNAALELLLRAIKS
ncbi:MAG: CinA family protein [Rhodobacteraceae bacterium]|nr:CinA family protein [Paracoccaceae bacterium]